MAIFFLDGGPPEIVPYRASSLSGRWSRVCYQMLDQLGVVFRHKMGDTLSHFDVHLAGPMGRMLVHGYACYESVISSGQGNQQDLAAIQHFEDFVVAACESAKAKLSAASRDTLRAHKGQPMLLMFDYCSPQIDADQKLAIGLLGVHLADAYFDYCEKANQVTGVNHGQAGTDCVNAFVCPRFPVVAQFRRPAARRCMSG